MRGSYLTEKKKRIVARVLGVTKTRNREPETSTGNGGIKTGNKTSLDPSPISN